MSTIISPPSFDINKYLFSDVPTIDSKTLSESPQAEVCHYKITDLDYIDRLPNLRQAVFSLPEKYSQVNLVNLLPNMREDVDFRYFIVIDKGATYTFTPKSLQMRYNSSAETLKSLQEKYNLEIYSGELSPEISRELLNFPKLRKVIIEKKQLPFLSDDLLSKLTSVRVTNFSWSNTCQEFMDRIRDRSYPNLKRFRFVLPLREVATYKQSFPSVNKLYLLVEEVVTLNSDIDSFGSVWIYGSSRFPHTLSLDRIYDNVKVFYPPVSLVESRKVKAAFPNVALDTISYFKPKRDLTLLC